MLALIRPDDWNLPLFLHVLGATILVGAMASTAIAARASSSPAIPRALPLIEPLEKLRTGVSPLYANRL